VARGGAGSPTISVPVRGTYEQWTTYHGLQAADAGADACLANDGVCNLVKYAAGLDPFAPAVQSTYLLTSVDSSTGNLNLDLTVVTDSDGSFLGRARKRGSRHMDSHYRGHQSDRDFNGPADAAA
jgi:hypothetical protein